MVKICPKFTRTREKIRLGRPSTANLAINASNIHATKIY